MDYQYEKYIVQDIATLFAGEKVHIGIYGIDNNVNQILDTIDCSSFTPNTINDLGNRIRKYVCCKDEIGLLVSNDNNFPSPQGNIALKDFIMSVESNPKYKAGYWMPVNISIKLGKGIDIKTIISENSWHRE